MNFGGTIWFVRTRDGKVIAGGDTRLQAIRRAVEWSGIRWRPMVESGYTLHRAVDVSAKLLVHADAKIPRAMRRCKHPRARHLLAGSWCPDCGAYKRNEYFTDDEGASHETGARWHRPALLRRSNRG